MRPRSLFIFCAVLTTAMLFYMVVLRSPRSSPPAQAGQTCCPPQKKQARSSQEVAGSVQRSTLPMQAAESPAVKIQSSGEMAAFNEWTRSYLEAAPKDRARMVEQGVRLAQARRPVFKELIKQDPRAALASAVPMVVRQKLPAEVVQQLEKRVNQVGSLWVKMGTPMPGEPLPSAPLMHREAEFEGGRFYAAYVYGQRALKQESVVGASLNGVSVDADFAVNEAPSRTLEVGEVPPADKPTVAVCPVSGLETEAASLQPGDPVTTTTPGVETATQIVFFCDGEHHVSYNEALLLGEGVTGGAFGFTGILPAAPTPALGVVKVLAIPMTYADQNAIPATEATLYNTLRDVSEFYSKASFGKLTLIGTVCPPVKLPHNEAWYVNRDTSNGGDISGTSLEHLHARDEARKMGFDSNEFDSIVVRHNGGPGSYGGLATVPGSTVWVRTDSANTWAHEIGHSFSLLHANFWDTAGTSSIGNGANAEYGDTYDIMGGSSFPAGHYNAQGKSQIKWLLPEFQQPVTRSGLYRIYAFDQGALDPSRRYAMTIVKDAQRTYWGEVRSQFDSNPWAKNGMILGWRFPNGGASNIHLIDTTNGSPFAKDDAPISLGSTFSDTESGIHLTTVAANDSPRYMDVQVNLGSFPDNQRPTLTLAASAEVVPLNATVTFTATASDPDNDTLAYAWQHFGSSSIKIVSPNSAVITRQFTTAGTYVVTCTVSDMKGGTCTRNKLITVGSASTWTISGRVTLLGQGLSDVVVTANGANGVITDSDGYYTVPNLAANTYTLTPLLYGYSFAELFNNSVTVGPNYTGADFEATAQSVVTLTMPLPTAYELAPVTAGSFRLSRTGDTSQPLVVNVNAVQGSATKTTDYTLSPDYVTGSQGFSTFTIPADSAYLDIAVTPVSDATVEGPETITLQVGPGIGYVVQAPSAAIVVLADDDTALPKLSLSATTPDTTEGSGTPMVLTVARTGSTTGPVNVKYAVSGTATSGVDYTALSGVVTIPDGSATADISISPLNDTLSEKVETVAATLSADAAYLVDSTASSATATIYDDDTQIVSVSVTDATATEIDLTAPGAQADTGTFLVTRSGDTSAALTVYYAFAGVYNSGILALQGVDYEAMPGSVVIPAGQTQASITILPHYDGIGEGPELVVLYLGGNATNYVLGGSSTATVTIQDNPSDLPSLSVTNTGSATEGGTAVFRITVRGGAGTGSLPVSYAFSGTATTADFAVSGTGNTLTGTSITLSNGATVTKDVTITAVDDAVQEDVESLTLTLASGAAYQSYAPTASATMWIKDNDYTNTVYVDTQVGTSGANSFTEGATITPVKFYVSRTGSTAAALTVNYTIGGTATSGSDYTALPGSVVIPAGSLGADVAVSIINDTLFEGTETITFDLAPGSYSRSTPGTVMYIADNDTATATVGFASPGSTGLESVATVSIPVTLSAAQAAPVTVEYAVSGTNQINNSPGSFTRGLPYWVRLVKTGSTITHYESNDGTVWTQRGGSFTVSGLGTSYLAGLVAASGSSTAATATIDNYSITGLSPGGTVGGTETRSLIGNATGGTHTVSNGVYSFNTPGNGVGLSSTSDNFCFVSKPVSSSDNCTITARVLTLSTTSSSGRLGVMLRSSTAGGSVYAASLGTGATTSSFYTLNRTALNSAANAPSALTSPVLPQWFRLMRVGDVFTVANSKDGITWANASGGTAQTISVSPTILVGLGVSAGTDGLVATGTFDNVSLNDTPLADTALQGRTIGFVNEQGTDSSSGGVWTLNGSGTNLNDEGHFAAMNVTGDFTFVARVTSLTGGATTAQAGILMRQSRDSYSKTMVARWIESAALGQGQRVYSFTSAQGSGVDFSLTPGVLTFDAGVTTQNIVLNVVNDSLDEPDNQVTIQLSNANGATVSGTGTYFSYTILDDDSPPASPYVGFATASSTVAESAGTVELTVSLSSAATTACTVDYAVTGGTATGGGTDYTLADGTLSFAAGETVKTIPLTIVDDSVVDAAETIIVTLASPSGLQLGSQTAHTVTITDNDLPVVSITASDASASEAGLDPGQFIISRTGSTAAALTVSLTRSGTAASGTDYSTISTTQTIPAGSASLVVNVTPLQDSTSEGTETVILSLAASASYTLGTPATATVSLLDDDRSTVTLVADDPTAEEGGGSGQFTITRTAPTNVSLTVSLTVAGTATNGTDYKTTGNINVPTSITLASGVSTYTIPIIPQEDLITEGDEQVTLSLNSGSYDIGAQSFGNVTIADNDNPPVLFINSPGSQGPLIANGNGVILSATITDDGFPAAVTQQWDQISGPGVATIETPAATTTAVTFSAPGTYILRITATDTQFTVSDQVTVVVGSGLVAADWITQDLGPSSARRGQAVGFGGQYSVTGTGAGYANASDQAHVMARQISGDGAIVARLTSLSTGTALSGLTVRDTMARAGRRVVLGLVPGSGLQLRTRATVNTTDTLTTSVAAPALPLWLKLERNTTTGLITASYATETSGVADAWVQLGAVSLTMDSAAHYGLTTTSNTATATATGIFDHLTLTPEQSGPALLSEDATASPAAAGSGSESSGTYTITGSTSGYFHGWQYYGDMVVTARLATYSSGAGSSSGGIRVAESLENGAQLHLGRMPTSAYNGYYWTALAGGSSGGVPSGVNAGNWIRFVRRSNSITAYRATDASGSPGTWVQIGQPQTIIMTTPVWVGFYVNNASGVGSNTCTFTNLSIAPLNKAPVVAFSSMATWPLTPVAVHGSVADDSYPAPATLTSLWSKISGPGSVSFGSPAAPDTTATLSQPGSYVLRLTADDTGIQSFGDLAFTGYAKAYEVWQAQNWAATGGYTDPNAVATYDSDSDGQANLLEYAFGTPPQAAGSSPLVYDSETLSTDKYLRITVPKNPAATDVTFTVEATSDLTNPAGWSSSGLVIEQDTSTQLIVRDAQPMAASGPRFMRVKVVRN